MFKRSLWILSACILLLAGCGGGDGEKTPTPPPDNQPPTAWINQPLDQALLPAGEVVAVDVAASDNVSVVRVELYVDGALIESKVAPVGSTLTAWRETFNWSASMVGAHTLQARAHDAAGLMGASPVVGVNVALGGQPIPPDGQPIPPDGQPTPAPTQAASPPAEATAVPPTVEPTAAPPEQPLVTASTNANVRSGPGTVYAVVGALNEGESARVSGRNSDSTWWQIDYAGGSAWIANVVVTANALAQTVPVVSAPPPPATNTPIPPTAAPTNTPGATTGLRVDQTALGAGQCTTLRWDYGGIKAIYIVFGLGYSEEGVSGHGTRQVCPSATTTYKARVVKEDNSVSTDEVTVTVSGSGCGDPIIDRFVSTTYDVGSDEPFSIFWETRCAVTAWLSIGDETEAVGASGKKISLRITGTTAFQLKLQKSDGNFVSASFTVNKH